MQGPHSLPYLKHLGCPQCYGELRADLQHSRISCQSCGYQAPILGGLPWLGRDPELSLASWQLRYETYLDHIDQEVFDLKASAALLSAPLSLKRLQLLIQGKTEQKKSVCKLLEPLMLAQKLDPALKKAAKISLPETQHLMSYSPNLMRDWDDSYQAECQQSLDICVDHLPKGFAPESVLILGPGASRLAIDLHLKLAPQFSLAVDINPLLLYSVQKILNGQSVDSYQFLPGPKKVLDAVIRSKIKIKKSADLANFYLMNHDGLNLGPALRGFDLVLSPWFIDIVPTSIGDLAQRVNCLLSPNGLWLNFGSFCYWGARWSQAPSREEALQLIEAQGFEYLKKSEPLIPYLLMDQNPQKRFEELLVFTAKKTAARKYPGVFDPRPSALRNPDLAIGRRPEYQQAIEINRIHAALLEAIDGQKTLRDLAAPLSQSLGLSEKEGIALYQALILQVYRPD